MPRPEFERLNAERAAAGEPLYMNPRNTAAGSLRQLDASITACAAARAVLYQLGWVEGAGAGVDAVGSARVDARPRLPDEPARAAASRPSRRSRPSARSGASAATTLDYDIDGVVVKVDEFGLQRQLGVVGREPRWATAYKFPAEQAVTLLRAIECPSGARACSRPFAVLEPVFVGGAHGLRRDAAQRGAVRLQGHPRRRRRDRAARRRRDPAGRRPGALEARGPRAAPIRDALGLPGLRHAGAAGPEPRRAPTARTATARSQLARQLEHFGSRGAMDIEGLGEQLAGAPRTRSASCTALATSTSCLDARGAARARRASARRRSTNLVRHASRRASTRPLRRLLDRPSASATSAARRRGRSRCTSAHGGAARRHARGHQGRRRHRADRRGVRARVLDDERVAR